MMGAIVIVLVAIPAQSPAEYRLSTSAWVADAPTKVAMALGAFDDLPSGRLTVVRTNSGRESLQQLLAGEADFATMATTPIARHACRVHDGKARADGVHPVVVASMALSNGTHFVLADGSAGIERPADLAGRRVGVMFETSAHFGWSQFARLHGLDDAVVELVDLPIDRLPAALLSDRIDAAVLWSPWHRDAVDRLGDDARRFPIRAVDSVNWLLVAGSDFVERNPSFVAEVLRAYREAVRMLNNRPDRAMRLHAGVSDHDLPDRDELAGVIWDLTLDWSLLANFQANVEWYERRSGMEALDVPIREFIANEPLERVAPAEVLLPAAVFDRAGEEPR
ncbi:MAG: ABC transporter substrate-binding protein [Candidatus Wenzhouxiangella sp. M2_3B_020]